MNDVKVLIPKELILLMYPSVISNNKSDDIFESTVCNIAIDFYTNRNHTTGIYFIKEESYTYTIKRNLYKYKHKLLEFGIDHIHGKGIKTHLKGPIGCSGRVFKVSSNTLELVLKSSKYYLEIYLKLLCIFDDYSKSFSKYTLKDIKNKLFNTMHKTGIKRVFNKDIEKVFNWFIENKLIEIDTKLVIGKEIPVITYKHNYVFKDLPDINNDLDIYSLSRYIITKTGVYIYPDDLGFIYTKKRTIEYKKELIRKVDNFITGCLDASYAYTRLIKSLMEVK